MNQTTVYVPVWELPEVNPAEVTQLELSTSSDISVCFIKCADCLFAAKLAKPLGYAPDDVLLAIAPRTVEGREMWLCKPHLDLHAEADEEFATDLEAELLALPIALGLLNASEVEVASR